MEISFIGFFVLPLALYFFFYKPQRLYELTVFSIPFTGTGLFTISSSDIDIAPVKASLFLGFLCLVRYSIFLFRTRKIRLPILLRPPLISLFCFLFFVFLSLLMPVLIEGDIDVVDVYSGSLFLGSHPHPIKFHIYYLTNALYMAFGCVLAYFFAVKNSTYSQLIRSIRVYINASIFVVCWGILEWVLFQFSIPYPSFIFNQASMNFRGPLQLGGYIRVMSVALEPSILSQQLLSVFPLLLYNAGGYSRRFYKLSVIALTLVLFACISTTTIVGLVFIGLILFFEKLYKGFSRLFFFFFLICVTFITIISAYQVYEKIMTTYSGTERLKSMMLAIDYFLQYPILGIGFGAVPVWDLCLQLFSMTGLLGLIAFSIMILHTFSNLVRKKYNSRYNHVLIPLQYSLLTLLFVSQLSDFVYYVHYFWFTLGICMSVAWLNKRRVSEETIVENHG